MVVSDKYRCVGTSLTFLEVGLYGGLDAIYFEFIRPSRVIGQGFDRFLVGSLRMRGFDPKALNKGAGARTKTGISESPHGVCKVPGCIECGGAD